MKYNELSCQAQWLDLVTSVAREYRVDRIILTTNGSKLVELDFLAKLCQSSIDTFNLSRMHYKQTENDRILNPI